MPQHQPIGMSKPSLGGSTKTTLPSSVIKPGKYKPKKFQMDMPDEKDSGMYGLKNNMDDELVESLALDSNENQFKLKQPTFMGGLPSLNSNPSLAGLDGKMGVQMKLVGPNIMRKKIIENLEERKLNPGKRPPSSIQKEKKDSDEDDYNNDFEDDAGVDGDDKLDNLRRALDKEN